MPFKPPTEILLLSYYDLLFTCIHGHRVAKRIYFNFYNIHVHTYIVRALFLIKYIFYHPVFSFVQPQKKFYSNVGTTGDRWNVCLEQHRLDLRQQVTRYRWFVRNAFTNKKTKNKQTYSRLGKHCILATYTKVRTKGT